MSFRNWTPFIRSLRVTIVPEQLPKRMQKRIRKRERWKVAKAQFFSAVINAVFKIIVFSNIELVRSIKPQFESELANIKEH
jgi:hypothetical protein